MPKDKQTANNLTAIIIPALITAVAGIIGAYFSYSAGVDAIRIPLLATQTAEAKQESTVSVTQLNGQSGIAVAIDSTKTWQPTGVFVSKGDTVNIRVTGGKWTTWREGISDNLRSQISSGENAKNAEIWINWHSETNGSGLPIICEEGDNCPVLNYGHSLLVARIGNTNYVVSVSCSFLATESGEIFLQANDGQLSDNSGVLAVEVNSDRFNTFSISTGCGIAHSK